jgi:hypothetical protein
MTLWWGSGCVLEKRRLTPLNTLLLLVAAVAGLTLGAVAVLGVIAHLYQVRVLAAVHPQNRLYRLRPEQATPLLLALVVLAAEPLGWELRAVIQSLVRLQAMVVVAGVL